MLYRLQAAIAGLAVAFALGAGTASAAGTALRLGAAEDASKSADATLAKAKMDLASLAGLDTIRLTSTWTLGQTAPSADELTRLQNAASGANLDGIRTIVAVFPAGSSQTPTTDAARADFVANLVAVARGLPSATEFVVGNEPNSNRFWLPQFDGAGGDAAAASYETLLAQAYDALHALRSTSVVYGGALAARGGDCATCAKPTHSPTAFIRDLGVAYRASGRTQPLMDAFDMHPYPDASNVPPSFQHPNATTISLADYPKLVAALGSAFDGTAQAGSTLPILYGEFGIETAVPADKAFAYTGTEPVVTVDAATQAAWYREAVKLAYCQPNVRGLLFFLVSDEPVLAGWQSGLRYADDAAKPAAATVATTAAASRNGNLTACPDSTAPSVRLTAPTSVIGTATLTAAPQDDVGVARVEFLVDGTVIKADGVPPYDASWTSTADGPHTLAARAYDAAGNATTDSVTTTVANAPDTFLDSASGGTFSFRGSTNASGFECAVDGGPFLSCASPASYTLSDGAHTFAVRARDSYGNVDQTPAGASWTVASSTPPSGGGGGGIAPPDLAVTLSAPNPAASLGGEVDVLARVDDLQGGATGVLLTIALPDGAGLLGPPASDRGTGCIGTTTISCYLDFMGAGMSATVRFAVRLTTPGAHELVATVTSREADVAPANNEARLTVATVSSAGPDPTPRNPTPPLPLDTRIVTASRNTHARTATIRFAATRAGATFTCKVDGGRWRACSSPLRLRNLATGPHTVWVRAAGDATPARVSWRVLR